ncbi:MAG: metallophosphoesterase family protein, partial [Acutalibacteraceae bacterium]|nr:metallophosphoesterase family protein [Acutalibacteraceae bacterium]
MKYVMSDIHGCYEEYLKALDMINFSDDDTLYILGDIIDRGYDSMKLMKDIMSRKNIIPLAGNHEFAALRFLKSFSSDSTENDEILKNSEDFLLWRMNGGDKTFAEFMELSEDERRMIVDYISEMSLYEEITVNDKAYLLVHAGLEPFDKDKAIEDYTIKQLLWSRPDYNSKYFDDRFTVTGHTPTAREKGNNGTIIKRNNHIAIDCGCVFGYNLAVFCLDTSEEFYIKAKCD